MRARALASLSAITSAAAIGIAFGIAICLAINCAVGSEEEPGCRADAECGEGWICRAGACFHATTDPPEASGSSVMDAGDGGDSGDGDGG